MEKIIIFNRLETRIRGMDKKLFILFMEEFIYFN